MRKRINSFVAIFMAALMPYSFGQGYYFARPAAGGGATYLINQGFEGAGYDNGESWTESGPETIDEDYTGTVLVDSQSLRIAQTGIGAASTSVSYAASDEVWFYCKVRPVVIDSSASSFIIAIRSAGANLCRIQTETDGRLSVVAGSTATTVDTLSTGTTYHVWVHYIKGTGANAVGSVAFSTSGTRPTSGNAFAGFSNGSATAQASTLILGRTATATQEFIFDRVLIDDALIGDSP